MGICRAVALNHIVCGVSVILSTLNVQHDFETLQLIIHNIRDSQI